MDLSDLEALGEPADPDDVDRMWAMKRTNTKREQGLMAQGAALPPHLIQQVRLNLLIETLLGPDGTTEDGEPDPEVTPSARRVAFEIKWQETIRAGLENVEALLRQSRLQGPNGGPAGAGGLFLPGR